MLDAIWFFALIAAAGTEPGGVVALQIGFNFYNVPLALSARSAGTVLLPGLARDAVRGDLASFRETYDRGVSWAWFVAAPATVTLVLLARPLAEALSFGQMQHGDGVALVAAAVAVLGLALLAAATNQFARTACYARRDVHAPLRSGVALIAVTLVGIPVAVSLFSGAARLAALGAVVVVGELTRAIVVDRAARRGTPSVGVSWWRAVLRHVLVALVTIGTAAVIAHLVLDRDGGRIGALAEIVLATSIGLLAYIGLQSALRAPELPAPLRRRSLRMPVAAPGGSGS
jgi:peptidoglycan biosynthesis protein MviN/MurJ (putative lipid II flippase)